MDVGILIGNTNTTIAYISKNSIRKIATCKTQYIGSIIKKYLNKEKNRPRVFVASVVPQATARIKHCTEDIEEISWKNFPSQIKIKHPENIGIDRLLNAAGAKKLFKNSCLIIDAGSAITIDFICKNGNFEGGVIFPGQRLIVESLKTLALLKKAKPTKSKSILGNDTSKAIGSGVTYGLSFLIKGYINAIKEKDKNVQVIFTGGDGKMFLPYVKIGTYEKNLALKGLQMFIYET